MLNKLQQTQKKTQERRGKDKTEKNISRRIRAAGAVLQFQSCLTPLNATRAKK